MPIKKLDRRAYDHLENLIWESDHYFTEREVIDGLNEYFAKMYGYGRGRPMRSRKTRSRRKLSSWQKFIKANSKKRKFKYRDGKLNLKKMGTLIVKRENIRKIKKRGDNEKKYSV
jgi:hypothetical protein